MKIHGKWTTQNYSFSLHIPVFEYCQRERIWNLSLNWNPDKTSHSLHLGPEVEIRLDFSGCNFNYDAYFGGMLFKRASRGTESWHPEPNKLECLAQVQFPQRRSKRAERKGVSKVSLELRANKNETILFWDLINFYIQSYTAHLFIAYD